MYGFAGLLGYMGLNNKGLSININMVVSDDWQPGVSPYLLVRHLLNFSTINECIDELKRIQQSSSRSFLFSDLSRISNVEFTGNEMKIIEGDCLLHTNHYLDSDLLKEDRIHFLFKNSSIKRMKVMQHLLDEKEEEINSDVLFEILSDHSLFPVGLCAHAEGNIRRSETVAAVVMEPRNFTLYARKGHACSGVTEKFQLTPQKILYE